MEYLGEDGYLQLMSDVLTYGGVKKDRTGVGTSSLHGKMIKYDASPTAFPLFTTKEINFASVASELLWFLEGSTDERRLAEIRYGKPRSELEGKRTIWTDNYIEFQTRVETRSLPFGNLGNPLGPIYGCQWREFSNYEGSHRIDQIEELVSGIKTDPLSRRHVVSAWNPLHIDIMALPPCHIMFQCLIDEDYMDMTIYMRSNDLFLGHPFNVASYALLLNMICHQTGYTPGELTFFLGDAHIYQDHRTAAREQLERSPLLLPILEFARKPDTIFDYKMEDFEIHNYKHHPKIRAKMAV